MSTPQSKARPQIRLVFDFDNLSGKDYGYLFNEFEFKGMMNGGYIIKATLVDAHHNLLSKLIKNGYFTGSRTKPVPVQFQILSGIDGKFPQSATRSQTAILTSLHADGDSADKSELQFVAIDPPSWHLNCGDGFGGVFKGRVDEVIRQVVEKYAPSVNLDIDRTVDSQHNKWWMMRQDPKTFINSFLDWSSAITQQKTNWILASDGYNFSIKEQAALTSKQRGFYRYLDDLNHDSIKSWEYLSDNALSAIQTKIITQGISSISGQYLDISTDQREEKVVASDKTTSSKQVAKTTSSQSFTKPQGEPPNVGWTSIPAIPEIYSSGELGLAYNEYVDGRPRGLWLGLTNMLMRVMFRVVGHGEWSDCNGLGVDTVFIRWTQGRSDDDATKYWWMTGNWLVYGFHHKVTRANWYTDLYCARFDHDSEAQKVGGSK